MMAWWCCNDPNLSQISYIIKYCYVWLKQIYCFLSFPTASPSFSLWDKNNQSTTTHPGSLTFTFLHIFPAKSCMLITSLPCVPHTQPISSSLHVFRIILLVFKHQYQKPTLKTSERWVANMFWSTHVLWFRPSACSNTFRTTPSKFCKLSNWDATCNIKIMRFSKYLMLYSKTNLYNLIFVDPCIVVWLSINNQQDATW